jgi:hypothetical protein
VLTLVAVRSAAAYAALALAASTVLAPCPTAAQSARADSPYDLARLRPGEPTWAPLMRLRAAAPRFAADTASAARATWLQLLAQAEATFGNTQRALASWDRLGTPREADLAATRQRFLAARQVSAFDTVLATADTARVIMVNERHHASADRVLTLRLLRALRAKGFRYFAAEAFAPDTALPTRGYALDDDRYTSEPVFAELVREARRLGYTLVPYEAAGRQFDEPDSLSPQQRRDYAQATNLAAATIARDPQAKVLVHAGFDHIRERATPQWSPMAAYFTARTGIDPVTIDQTSGTERGTPAFAHPVHRALAGALSSEGTVFVSDSTATPIGSAAMAVDLVVIRTAGALIDGRPAYLTLGGTRRAVRVATPACRRRHCVLTAHHAHEPDAARVLDRVEVHRADGATLFLPTTPVRLTVYTVDGRRLRQWTLGGRAR